MSRSEVPTKSDGPGRNVSGLSVEGVRGALFPAVNPGPRVLISVRRETPA